MLYFNVGKHLSENSAEYSFGDKYIDEIAEFIVDNHPGNKGFNRRGLYRMKQFYETYKDDEFVSALLTQSAKIACGYKHFEALGQAVVFDKADSFEGFLDKNNV